MFSNVFMYICFCFLNFVFLESMEMNSRSQPNRYNFMMTINVRLGGHSFLLIDLSTFNVEKVLTFLYLHAKLAFMRKNNFRII